MGKAVALRGVLAILCVYHLTVGLVACLAPGTTLSFAEWFYGIQVTQATAQFVYMLKALGMYALFTGSLLCLAVWNPARYRHLILATAGLLLMRTAMRLVFFDTLNEAFAVTWAQNLVNVAMLIAQAGVLLWASEIVRHSPGPSTRSRPLPWAAAHDPALVSTAIIPARRASTTRQRRASDLG